MLALFLAAVVLQSGNPDYREYRMKEAIQQREKAFAAANLKLSPADRAAAAAMEQQYQDARILAESLSETLASTHDDATLDKLTALRSRIGKVLSAYAPPKEAPAKALTRIRAFQKSEVANPQMLETLRDALAKIRFEVQQQNPEMNTSVEVFVISAPKVEAGRVIFGCPEGKLTPGRRVRVTRPLFTVFADAFDSRNAQLTQIKESPNVQVTFFDGDTVTYKTRDGSLSTTWDRGDDRVKWQVLQHPEGSATTEAEDYRATERTHFGRFLRIVPKQPVFVLELRVTGEVEWKMSGTRNGRSVNSAEKNPVTGVLRLRVRTL